MTSIPRPLAHWACVILALLGVPATASAVAVPATPSVLTAKIGSVKHYAVFLSATPVVAQVHFVRKAHGAKQSHTLDTAPTAHVAYTASGRKRFAAGSVGDTSFVSA